jgi:exopolysaccharide biosynthesis protein
VRKAKWILWALISLGLVLSLGINNLSQAQPNSKQPTALANTVRYDVYQKSHSTIHTITIPHNSKYSVLPAVEDQLTPLTSFATKHNAIAAINGGYFDPKNQKTTSYIIEQERIVADPRLNERLVDNPDLKPYLGKILNRAEFRRYQCGTQILYDIQLHSAPIQSNCTLKAALAGGPGLLPTNTSVAEGFLAYQGGKIIRDAIGSTSLNARSAVGITGDRDLVLVMVAQQPDKPTNSGISLLDLADFLSTLGVTKAMNLDGGSSASLYYQGKTFYGKVDREANEIKRPIKSVLLVTEDLSMEP